MSPVAQMQFDMHKIMNELEHHRRVWNPKQHEKLNAVLRSSDDTNTIIESLQLKIQDMVFHEDFQELQRRFDVEAVTRRDLHGIWSELKGCVREGQVKDLDYEV